MSTLSQSNPLCAQLQSHCLAPTELSLSVEASNVLATSSETLSGVAGGVLSGDLIDSTFAVINHVVQARRCSLMLLDDEQKLVVHKANGLGQDVVSGTRLALGERIAGRVGLTRQPILITDIRKVDSANGDHRYATGSFISVPIAKGDQLFGVLNAADKIGDRAFDEFDLQTLVLLAQHLALCLENEILQRRIAQLANTDGLTGLYNHRYFQERLDEELARASRFDRTVALLMTDLDQFKEFNDRYGHPSGDMVLRWVANMLREAVRQSDIVCRYGGDEFAIIAPETDEAAAGALAKRLVDKLSSLAWEWADHPWTSKLSLTVGFSVCPVLAANKHDLIEQADRAMYRAKASAHRSLPSGRASRDTRLSGYQEENGPLPR